MENKQLRNLGFVLILPVLFAGIGYFGMKIFLSGSGPETVMPETDRVVSEKVDDNKSLITDNGATDNDGQSNTELKNNENVVISTSGTSADVITVENNETDEQPTNSVSNINDSNSETMSSTESKNEGENNSENLEQYKFDGLNFYSLQVGSYSSLSNANQHVETLKAEGLMAYVFTGNNYKVMVGANVSRDGVDALKATIVESIPDAFVKGMMVVPDSIEYPTVDKALKDDFDDVMQAYIERLNGNLNFLSELDITATDQNMTYIEADRQKVAELKETVSEIGISGVFDGALVLMEDHLVSIDMKLRQYINGTLDNDDIFEMYIREIMQFNKLN